MDAIKMQYEFNNYCRNHDAVKSIDYTSDDVELYLNDAQELVTDKYIELFNKEEYARTYLNNLIASKAYALVDSFTITTSLSNGLCFELPDDLKYNIPELEEAIFTLNSITYRSRVKPIIGKHYNLNKLNPFKKPYKNMVWRIQNGQDAILDPARVHQIVLPANATLSAYYINYIRYPDAIDIYNNTSSELDASIHKEIVIKAVDLFLKSVENNLFLTRKMQNS